MTVLQHTTQRDGTARAWLIIPAQLKRPHAEAQHLSRAQTEIAAWPAGCIVSGIDCDQDMQHTFDAWHIWILELHVDFCVHAGSNSGQDWGNIEAWSRHSACQQPYLADTLLPPVLSLCPAAAPALQWTSMSDTCISTHVRDVHLPQGMKQSL